MDLRKIARWLALETDDETFAEFFVTAYKMWKTNNIDVEITKETMQNIDTEKLTGELKLMLNEIIFSEEIAPSCWWKKQTIFYSLFFHI